MGKAMTIAKHAAIALAIASMLTFSLTNIPPSSSQVQSMPRRLRSMSTEWLPSLPDYFHPQKTGCSIFTGPLKKKCWKAVKPDTLLPKLHGKDALKSKKAFAIRDSYFKEMDAIFLLLALISLELLNQALSGVKGLISHGGQSKRHEAVGDTSGGDDDGLLGCVPDDDDDDDDGEVDLTHPVPVGCFILLHVLHHLVCISLVTFAVINDLIDSSHGIVYEFVAIWLFYNIIEMALQVIARAATSMKPDLVVTKIAISLTPSMSDRPDTFMDWIFAGCCFQSSDYLVRAIGFLSVLDIVFVYGFFYYSSYNRSFYGCDELQNEFLCLLTPARPSDVSFAEAFKNCKKFMQFCSEKVEDLGKTHKVIGACCEDLIQSVLKTAYVLRSGSPGTFLWFTLVVSVVKVPALWCLAISRECTYRAHYPNRRPSSSSSDSEDTVR